MGTQLLFLGLVIVGIVSGNHVQAPHLCDGEGESSEECNFIVRPKMADVNSLRVQFYLYKDPQHPDNFTEIFIHDVESIKKAKPYPPRHDGKTEWKILIPGFPLNGKSPFPNNVIQAYMQRMHNMPEERYNILVVDWNKGPCVSDTNFENTTYTGAIGELVAEMLVFLNDEGFLSLRDDAHIIGFSSGAHVAGEASRVIFRNFNKKNLLYRITALDPAGNRFWPTGYFENLRNPTPWERVPRIRRSFVYFLDVIHTSKEYGIGRTIGDVDFYPNCGDAQAGCKLGLGVTKLKDFQDLCSHVYATEVFARSINDKSMQGCTGCDYCDLYKNGRCGGKNCEDTPVIGEFVDDDKYEGYPRASGKAFISPGDLANFGKRLQKRLEDAGEPQGGRRKWRQLCD